MVCTHSRLSPKTSTPNPKPWARNPKPQTPNPKPRTQNPKPWTRNPKPQTPKPQTLKQVVSTGALPNGPFSFENQAPWWLGDAGEPITYRITLSKPGFIGKSMEVTYQNGAPGELFKSVVVVLAEDLPKVHPTRVSQLKRCAERSLGVKSTH